MASSVAYSITYNAPPIPGAFEIVSKNSGKCLDVFNHSLADNAGLSQWDCTHEPHQRFKLLDMTRGSFQLKALRNNFCLTTNSPQNGSRVVQRAECVSEMDPAVSDYVRFTPMDDGKYRISFTNSGRCMDVTGASKVNGEKVQIWDCHTGANQRWELRRVAPIDQAQVYSLVNEVSGKCLDVTDRSLTSGTQLQVWSCTREANQVFTFREGNEDLVSTTANQSGLNMAVAGGSLSNGAAVQQLKIGTPVPSSALGRFVPVSRDAYTFRFYHSGKCLTATGASDGSKIVQQDCDGRDGQRWILRALN